MTIQLKRLLSIFSLLASSIFMLADTPILPTLPQATVDLTMPTQSGTTFTPADSAAFATALTSSTCGDTIVLTAGTTYTGNFTIPNKVCSGWIVIKSSDLASLPASGTRISTGSNPPTSTIISHMPKIVTNAVNTPAINFAATSHHWRLIGLEITSNPAVAIREALVKADTAATSASQLSSFVIIDRCYIHGSSSSTIRRAVSLQVISGAVVDSDIREIHEHGIDSQGIWIYNTPGPTLFKNNFLSAGSENTLFGGADPAIANLVPSDITVVGNYYWKDPSWFSLAAGINWDVKNIFELKNAQRLLVQGNIFRYNWTEGQSGTAILLTPRNQSGGCTWCTVADVTYAYNLLEHSGQGFETASSDNIVGASQPTQRVLVSNNVFNDINSTTWGKGSGGRSFQSYSGTAPLVNQHDITIDHNTAFANAVYLVLGDSGTISNYQLTNNIGNGGAYGIIGAGHGAGTSSVNAFIPGAIYNKNAFQTTSGAALGTFPAGTFWNTTAGTLYTDFAGGNFQLQNGSAYHNAGTDGKDIGVWDWTIYNTLIANAEAGSVVGGSPVGPQANISPSSLDFGAVLIFGSGGPSSITVTNGGDAILNISSISITGTSQSEFSKTQTCGATLAVSASCTISVTFSPVNPVEKSATLTISDDAPPGFQSVPLTGSAVIHQGIGIKGGAKTTLPVH